MRFPAPPQPQPQPRTLHPKIWRACAGASVQTPTVNSRVYYFPQGHLDQASSPPQNLSPLLRATPFIICHITSVQLLADPITDEVFAKLILHPCNINSFLHPLPLPSAADDENDVVSVAKVLTLSDASNGGGFSVPRICADTIFPPLNFQDDPPLQKLSITDVHGVAWEFRHIYRGKPQRHLLTTGWGKFVDEKQLIAHDSVVFMKNSMGEMFVGIRRTQNFASGKNGGTWSSMNGGIEEEEEKKLEEKGFSRKGKGNLTPTEVAEAAEAAVRGMPFEVVYYPSGGGWSDFVVKAEIVEKAKGVVWVPGMRVKMGVEKEDSSRMSWFQGTVSSISPSPNPYYADWSGSPWRMLQVEWDDDDDKAKVLRNAKWVSPWQVEALDTEFLPTKRFRLRADEEVGNLFFPPVGMQGARHDHLLSASNLSSDNNSPLCMGNSLGMQNNTAPTRSQTLSTQLNIGTRQTADNNLSPEFVRTRNCNSTKPPGSGSFKLFGVTIQTTPPGSHGKKA